MRNEHYRGVNAIRGLLRDCTTSPINRFAALVSPLLSLPCALPFLVPSTIYTAEIGFRTIVPIAIQSGLFCWQGGQLKLCFAFLHIVIILSAPFFLPHLEMVPLFGRSGANGSSHYQNDHPHPQRNVDPQ